MKIDFRPMQSHPSGAPRPNYPPGKRARPIWRWRAILTVLALPFVYTIFLAVHSLVDISEPGYLSLPTVDIKSETSGIVTEIFVRPGNDVQTGARLVAVSDPRVTARIRSLEEELRALQAAPPQNAFDSSSARAEIAMSASEQLQEARRNLAQTRNLLIRGAVTEADAQAASDRVQTAQSAYLRAHLDASAPGATSASPTYEQIALTSELRTLQRTVSIGMQRAPFSGRIIAVNLAPGASVSNEQTELTIERRQSPHVLAYLDPEDASVATIGRTARVEFPGHGFVQAHVSAVSAILEPRNVVETTLVFDKPLEKGMEIEHFPVYVHFSRFTFQSLLR